MRIIGTVKYCTYLRVDRVSEIGGGGRQRSGGRSSAWSLGHAVEWSSLRCRAISLVKEILRCIP